MILSEARDIYLNHEEWARRYYEILNEDGLTVPFHSFTLGRRISESMRKHEATSTAAGYMIVLKPRRAYASAHLVSEAHRRTAFIPGRRAWINAQLLNTAHELFEYAKGFEIAYRDHRYGRKNEDGSWFRSPAEDCVFDIPELVGRRKSRIVDVVTDLESVKVGELRWAGGSALQVATAKNPNAMRGKRANIAILTEAAYYGEMFDEMRAAIMGCVPNSVGNWAIMESTARGQGNGFHSTWVSAIGGENEWIPVFVGTHQVERYRMPLSVKPEQFLNSMTIEERQRYEKYKLKPEQLQWYKYILRNKYNGDTDTMRAEFPYEWQEAFVGTGANYFDMGVVGRQPVQPPAMTGTLREDDTPSAIHKRVIFEPRSDVHGILRVWRLPEKYRRYSIGADTAQGKDTWKGKKQNLVTDFSAAVVVDVDSGEQVATLRARLAPLAFAEQLYVLSKFFNWAFVTPEANDNGVSVIEFLKELRDFPLSRLYMRRQNDRADALKMEKLHNYGWLTTNHNRIPLLQGLARAMRDGQLFIRDPIVQNEMMSFISRPADGKPEHEPGRHDDTVFAAALAEAGVEQALAVFALEEDMRINAPKGDRFEKYAPARRTISVGDSHY